MNEERELALWAAYKVHGDKKAREDLILAYMPHTVKLVLNCGTARHPGRMDDSISEAYVALIECVDKFDVSCGLKFMTMARKRILGAVIDYARSLDPGHRRKTPFELIPVASLVDDEDNNEPEFFAVEDNVLQGTLASEDSQALGELLKALPFSERCVLLLRVFEKVPHKDIALGMGVSANRTRQLVSLLKRRLCSIYTEGAWPWRTPN